MPTLISEPGNLAPAYNPLEYVLTSVRTGVETQPVTNVIDNGSGYCRIYIDNSGGEFLLNDVIRGSDFTTEALNAEMLITATAATYIDTDIAFGVGYATTGTVTRANNVTYIGTFQGGVVEGVFYVAARNGETTIDVSRFVQSYLSEDRFTTAGYHSPSDSVSSANYRVEFTEQWVRDNGTLIEDLTPLLTSWVTAFNIALNGSEEFTDYVMSTGTPGKFLTRVRTGKYNEKYCLAFLTEAEFVTVVVRRYTGLTVSEIKYTDEGIEDNRGAIYLDSTILGTGFDRIEISIWDADPAASGVIMSEVYEITPTLACGKKLVEWKNKLGGFEYTYFAEYTNQSKTKISQLKESPPTVAFIENGLAVALNPGHIDEFEADYYEDLSQSRLVYFEDLPASVANNKLKYSRNPIKNSIVLTLNPKVNN